MRHILRSAATLLTLVTMLLWGTFAANAQASADNLALDYASWDQLALRAEAAVEAGRASNDAFTSLRGEVVDWRSKFQAAQNTNATRLETVRGQMATLGAAPAEGETEAPEIAARRAELNEQISVLETPRRKAEEAFSRADGIIQEIDLLLRERSTDALLQLGPSPINLTLWPNAVERLYTSAEALLSGVRGAWMAPVQRANAQEQLPLVLGLLLIAFVLITRSRKLIERLAIRIEARETDKSAGFTGFVVSLGQVFFPFLGFLALTFALQASGLYGPRGGLLLETLPMLGLVFFGARWLGGRIFPPSDAIESPIVLPSGQRVEARFYTMLLGLIFALWMVLAGIADLDSYTEEQIVVLNFPLFVSAGLLMMRLGAILRKAALVESTTGTEESRLRHRLTRILGTLVILAGLIGPVAAAIGYFEAAQSILFPTLLTLALIATLAVLQEAVRDFFGWISRSGSWGRDSLMPVLVNFLLVLFALPVLALIWGARITDLTELWAQFKAGFTIGETTLSPGAIITLLVVFIVGFMATRLVQATLKTSVLPRTRMDVGGRTAIISGIGYVGIFLAGLVAITAAGINLSSLAIVAGALSVGIGFGLQNIVSNFVSGIILLIERPVAEGDWIEVGTTMGIVRDISVRSTRIETFDRTDVIVPNADLISGTVTNWTRGNSIGRVIVPVGVAYGTDTRKVEGVLKEIALDHPMVMLTPAPAVVFMGFGADSMDFEIRAILRDVNYVLSTKSDMNHAIAKRFTEEGIEIPFAQRDVWLRNPETLSGSAKPGSA